MSYFVFYTHTRYLPSESNDDNHPKVITLPRFDVFLALPFIVRLNIPSEQPYRPCLTFNGTFSPLFTLVRVRRSHFAGVKNPSRPSTRA